MEYLDAAAFLGKISEVPLVDARSPGEYDKGHIPGAKNLPLFNDEERAEVGTLYKQAGKVPAIDKALEIVQPKEQELAIGGKAIAKNNHIMVYCWRGGMRSKKMAEGFEANGLECFVLEGGYKAYRNQVLSDFQDLGNLVILQGQTGSGKTEILHELEKLGEQVIDLEGLANHRGSAFGGIGLGEQPTTSQFQNNVHGISSKMDSTKRIWIESESVMIGRIHLPETLWKTMNSSRVTRINMSKAHRTQRIIKDYGKLDPKEIEAAIKRIEKRMGGQHVKTALEHLEANEVEALVQKLLEYYDKTYTQSRETHKSGETFTFDCATADAATNAAALVEEANKNKL